MAKRYVVSLSDEEKMQLESMLRSGVERVRKMTHARILLRANDGWTDEAIQTALDVSLPTIQRVRYRFVEQSFEAALCPRPTRRKYERLLDGVQEAYLVALTVVHRRRVIGIGACACWPRKWCGWNTWRHFRT